MNVRDELVAQLRRYDDDAWATLANRGLLRRARKDLATDVGGLREVPGDGAQVKVEVGAQTVTFDARGPAHAACSCPSVTVCQHVLAAGLWLADGEPDEPAVDLHATLMSLGEPQLAAHAGKAGLRWAQQYVAGLDVPGEVQVESSPHVAITLPHPRVTFRFMGGGPDALVADVRLPVPERYQAAAVLAYQAVHGVPVVAPERRPRTPDARLADARTTVRGTVTRLLEDTVALGIAHVSPATAERYRTAAVSAQGVEYHRLARLLRGLSDQVELLLARSARADEQRVLDDVAVAYALVAALSAAEAVGEQPSRLVGSPRRRYENVRSMDLLGLGATPWRSSSGYQGLTVLFWWPEGSRFVSVTDARPTTVAFDPRGRYSAPGPWSGLHAPRSTTGALVRLTQARLAAGGRLSAAESTHATATAVSGAALADALPVTDVWSTLQRGGSSLLDEPDPLEDWAVLRPAAFGPARYDEAAQVLEWPLLDAAGDGLVLAVPYSALDEAMVERLDALSRSGGPAPGRLVVARLRPGVRGLTGEPLSLVQPGRAAGEAVEALHFPEVAKAKRPWRSAQGRRAPRSESGSETTGPPDEIVRFRAWLARQAERGTSAGASVVRELSSRHETLRAAGLSVFRQPDAGQEPNEVAGALLRSSYLALQLISLAGGLGDDRDADEAWVVDDPTG